MADNITSRWSERPPGARPADKLAALLAELREAASRLGADDVHVTGKGRLAAVRRGLVLATADTPDQLLQRLRERP